ncbi:MAG: polyprenyl diphosphate synthase [Candidatus Micrarchaeota archaeon]|nr:polyprenyl diphosphate synthase [Candidatus Micrarchaeota archaeon]
MKISHIAFIPDGNRRWAKAHGLSVIKGHEKGIDKMGEVLKWCQQEGIKTISFWAFSTENFNRDKEEVSLLFKAFKNRLQKVLEEAKFEKSKTKVRFVGQKELFPKEVQKGMELIEKKTQKYSDFYLNFFIGYGGKAEIIHAIKGILKDYSKADVDKINEQVLEKYLWSGNLPEPDLIIRTSGEQRLSGFLPLKSCYSELYFCKKYWPDFTYEDFYKALKDFHKRVRRWGR